MDIHKISWFWLANTTSALIGVKTCMFLITKLFGMLTGSLVYVLLKNKLSILLEQRKTSDLKMIFKPMILFPLIGLALLSPIPAIYKNSIEKDE
jgi:hypothetical protein